MSDKHDESCSEISNSDIEENVEESDKDSLSIKSDVSIELDSEEDEKGDIPEKAFQEDETLPGPAVTALDVLDWSRQLFPAGVRPPILINEDIITKEESDLRIIWFQLILGGILSFAILVLVMIFGLSNFKDTPIVVQPKIKNVFEEKFPVLHLALISKNGSAYDWSSNEDISPSKGFLLKLPKSKKYFGYSDPEGSLYFLDGELKKPLTKYNKKISNSGFETYSINTTLINTSSDMEHTLCLIAISVGNILWLTSKVRSQETLFEWGLKIVEGTEIWSKKKQRIRSGPSLPLYLIDTNAHEDSNFCATSLNSTHFFIVGFPFDDGTPTQKQRKRTALADFYYASTYTWAHYPNLPLTNVYQNCQATLSFNKNGNIEVFVYLQEFIEIYCPYIACNTPSDILKHTMYAYDLSQGPNGNWRQASESIVDNFNAIVSKFLQCID